MNSPTPSTLSIWLPPVQLKCHLLWETSLHMQWPALPRHQLVPDGVQHMLPQNMAPWHIAYFKSKESEKMAEARRSLWPLPPHSLFYPPETGLKPSGERGLPKAGGRGHPVSEDKGTLRRVPTNKLCSVSRCLLSSVPEPLIFLQNFSFFIKPSISTLRSNCFFASSFPYEEASCIM